MAVSDVLDTVGKVAQGGARVAGAVAPVVAQVIGDVSDPDQAAQRRQHDYAQEDAAINAKAQLLHEQLQAGQRYGTLTPEQQADLGQQITGLYNQPRHAPMLMDRLRQMIHPQGTVAQAPMSESLGLPAGTSAYPSQGTYQFEQDNKAYKPPTPNSKYEALDRHTIDNFGVPFKYANPAQQESALDAYALHATKNIVSKIVQDKESPTGYSYSTYNAITGEGKSLIPGAPTPRGSMAQDSVTRKTDEFGNVTFSVTQRTPHPVGVPNQPHPETGPTVQPVIPPTPPPEPAAAPTAGAKKPAAKGVAGALTTAPGSAAPTAAPAPTATAAPQAPLATALSTPPAAGGKQQLDSAGNIPDAYPANQMVREFANQVLHGRDIDTIPPKAKGKTSELASKFGWDATQTELTPQAQQVVVRTKPVLTEVDRLISDIERMGLQNNNTVAWWPGSPLFGAAIKYKMGSASDADTLAGKIAELSLGSLVEATSALNAQGGGSRALPALQIALQHTPNPNVDSAKNIYDKLKIIRERLNDVVQSAQTEGKKHYSPTAAPQSPPVSAPSAGAKWSQSKWLAAHPDGNIDAAVKEAKRQGREVVQ